MSQLSAQYIAKDLGIAVGMGWEARLGCDAVFVEDAQAAKAYVLWVGVGGEGEGVVGVEPAEVGMAAGVAAARDDMGVGEGFGHSSFEAHGLLLWVQGEAGEGE